MSIEFFARTTAGWLVRPRFIPFKFPGGEWHIKNEDNAQYVEHFAVVRGADVNDIVVAALWADMLQATAITPRHLFLPYIPAARADRGEPWGVVVYGNIIDTIKSTSVTYIDPHSEVASHYYAAAYEINAARVAVRATAGRSGLSPYVGVIAPDKGAHARAKAVGDMLGVPTYYAQKERDFASGNLKGFLPPEEWDYTPAPKTILLPTVPPQIPESTSVPPSSGRYLVVDDICDGGGTFMGLASVLGIDRENLDLWVTHGIFSGKAAQLTEAYGNIYTTDSHPGAYNEDVGAQVTKLLPYFFDVVRLRGQEEA